MLKSQADTGNAYPAAHAHNEGAPAGFDKFYDVCVQTDGCHCPYDKEL